MDEFNSKLDAILKSLGKPTELECSMACYVGGIERCVEHCVISLLHFRFAI
jgi:hypothetical protein